MDQAPLAHVDVAPVLVKRIRHWDEFNGRISAVESVEIRSRVSGYVTRVAYKEGDEVRRGDLLFAIDPRPYQAVLNSAAAQLERTRATALLAKGRDLRARKLLPSSAVSQDEADARHATHAQSEADVLNAEAAVDIAQLNLGFTEVRAPIDGRAGRAMLTAGNLVVSDQTLLTTMVSQDPVYVDFDPDEQSYLRYSANARRDRGNTLTVRVALAGEESFAHMGMVDFLDHQVDSAIVAGHILADTYALLRQCRRRAVGDHAVDEVPASRPPDAGSKRSCASSCAQESAAQICHMQLKSKHASLLVSPQKRLVQRRKC